MCIHVASSFLFGQAALELTQQQLTGKDERKGLCHQNDMWLNYIQLNLQSTNHKISLNTQVALSEIRSWMSQPP